MRKCTLSKHPRERGWDLTDDDTHAVLRRFPTKEHALRSGALRQALGEEGGSVRVRKMDGTYGEERTFPRASDPRRSPG